MSIACKIQKVNIQEAFFPVEERPIGMSNVLTDYASYPVARNSLGNACQVRVTEWLDKTVEAAKAPYFKLSNFVKDYLDTSYYLESLVQN